MKKRLISLMLAVAVCLSLIPMAALPAAAASGSGDLEENAFSALGIDTSKAPEGYDPNSRSNPYGKDTATLNPVGEFYTLGLSEITANTVNAYGTTDIRGPEAVDPQTAHGSCSASLDSTPALKSTVYGQGIASSVNDAFSKTATASADTSRQYIFNYNYSYIVTNDAHSYLQNYDVSGAPTITATAAGNFDGKSQGKKAQIAMVYTSGLDHTGGLQLKVGDATGSFGQQAITLIDAGQTIGNPGVAVEGRLVENFYESPYLLQNYLQVTTGDYDNDGTDEIAVYVPEHGASRIAVYKLKNTSTAGAEKYKDPNEWVLAWTYSLMETNYVSNMVSLTSGDFNDDGTDDVAATWGYYYGPDNYHSSTAVVLFGSSGDGKMLQKSQKFDLTYGSDQIVRGAFAYGDMTGGGKNALILGGQLAGDINDRKISRFVAAYNWNGTAFDQTSTYYYDLFSKDKDGHYTYDVMSRTGEVFYSAPLCVTNIEVVEQGLGKNAQVYIDSLVLTYGEDGLTLTATLDNKAAMQADADQPVYYVEYGGVSTDLVGLGSETFMTLQQTASSYQENTVSMEKVINDPHWESETKYYYKSWWHKLWGIKTWYTADKWVTERVATVSDTLYQLRPGHAYQVYFGGDEDAATVRTEVDYSQSICVANTDEDTTYLRYKRKYFTYSDPKVLAVLASPPYFEDLIERKDLHGTYDRSTTSYKESTETETGSTVTASITAGMYVSFEEEISVFGVKVASMEAETEIKAIMTGEYETSTGLEQAVTYSTEAGQDTVVFYSLPLEIYEYQAFVPDGNGNYKEQLSTVTIPHDACIETLPLKTYEAIAADYPALPRVSGKILTHTLGEPSTYPSSSRGYTVIAEYNGDSQTVGFGIGSAEEELRMSKSQKNSFETVGSIDVKVGAGAGGVTAGVIAGSEAGGGTVKTTTDGSSFTGDMHNMPDEAEPFGYHYDWSIFAYEGAAWTSSGQVKFPVVSYIVTDVTAPAPLPTDFAQDAEHTTTDSVRLTWTYDKSVAGFQLYRYYDFPDGAGSYELAFVPMTAGRYDETTGRYSFSYTDPDLSPYTDYKYQIQTVRAAVPNNSIYSRVLTARTKSAKGNPEIRLVGLNQNNELPIYPDAPSQVQAVVDNADIFRIGETTNLSFQWQVDRDGSWTELPGKTTDTLTFTSAGSSDQAVYRCRINAVYFDSTSNQEYCVSAYSDAFSTVYSKRTPAVLDGGFTSMAEDQQPVLKLQLISADAGHFAAPLGVVTFHVSGTDYSADYSVDLKNTGATSDQKQIGEAVCSFASRPLPDGVYEITASYGGSRIFKALEVSEPITAVVGSNTEGCLLDLRNDDNAIVTSFTYGDTITVDLRRVTKESITAVTDATCKLDDLSDDVPEAEATLSNGKLPTPAVGEYMLTAYDGDRKLASRTFVVQPREIAIRATSAQYPAGHVLAPEYTLSPDTPMAFDETIAGLSVEVLACNTAGNGVEINADTLPGNYTITPGPGADADSKNRNYSVTWVSASYTITAQTYEVQAVAETDNGTVALTNKSASGGSDFSSGTDLLFYAAPYNGYEVAQWIPYRVENDSSEVEVQGEGGASLRQTGGTTYHYAMKDEKLKVVVSFAEIQPTLTVNSGQGGSITNDASIAIGEEVEVWPGADPTFTAAPDPGYHFVQWQMILVGDAYTAYYDGTENADGTNSLTIVMPAKKTTLYALFERDSYTLTLGENLEAFCPYDHDGDAATDPVEQKIASGETVPGDTAVTVRARPGYSAERWNAPRNAAVNDDGSITFPMQADTAVTARTVRNQYALSTQAEHGTITLTGAQVGQVAGGTGFTAAAVPDYGYAFARWIVNGEQAEETSKTLTVDAMAQPMTIRAEFTQRSAYTIQAATGGYTGRAALSYTLVDGDGVVRVTDGAVINGSIQAYQGDSITLQAKTGAGFMVGRWTIDDATLDSTQREVAFENVSSDHSATATIIPQAYYEVRYGTSITATSDGIPFQSGSRVGSGTVVVFEATVPQGQMVDRWTVNGAEVTSENLTALGLTMDHYRAGTVTVNGLSSAMEVSVAFTAYVDYAVTVEKGASDQARAAEGAMVTVTADEPAAGLVFDKWTTQDGVSFTDPSAAETTFRMPAKPVTVTATYRQKSFPGGGPTSTAYAPIIPETAHGKVTVDPDKAQAGETVTVTATPEEGYALASLTVTDSDGKPVQLSKKEDGTCSFTQPEGEVTITAVFREIPPERPFLDVEEDDWFYQAVYHCYEKGYFQGVSETEFAPKGEMTRAMFAAVLYRIAGEPQVTGENPFTDVKDGRWYTQAVLWAAGEKLIEGYGDGRFGTKDPITREQIVAIFWRYCGKPAAAADLSGYKDADQIRSWARDAFAWAVATGLIQGNGEGMLNPRGFATRAQVAQIVMNYDTKIG